MTTGDETRKRETKPTDLVLTDLGEACRDLPRLEDAAGLVDLTPYPRGEKPAPSGGFPGDDA